MDVLLDRLQDLGGGIELGRLREMRDVAGMDHHRRLFLQLGDAVKRRLQGGVRVGVGLLVEADMAVADLDEGEPVARRRSECLAQSQSARNPARDRPDDAGTGPSHAFEETAAVNAVFIVVVFYDVWHIASRFKVYWIVFARGTCRVSIDTYRPGWLNIPG